MSAIIIFTAVAIAQLMLAVAMAIASIRMFHGPRAQDRIIGLDTLYINAMLLLVTFGIGIGRVVYFEAALVIGLTPVMIVFFALVGGEIRRRADRLRTPSSCWSPSPTSTRSRCPARTAAGSENCSPEGRDGRPARPLRVRQSSSPDPRAARPYPRSSAFHHRGTETRRNPQSDSSEVRLGVSVPLW